MGRPKLSEEEKKQRNRERQAKWRAKNPERYKEYQAEYQANWYQEHKEERAVKHAKYNKTPIGRAIHIASAYDRSDIKYNRGKCTLTGRWIVDNIFPMPCHYCGAMGWEIMGCDRVDNSKPHTPDNVVPCCAECNRKRGSMSYEDFVSMFKINELWQN